MNTFETIQCSINDVRVCSMLNAQDVMDMSSNFQELVTLQCRFKGGCSLCLMKCCVKENSQSLSNLVKVKNLFHYSNE